MTSKIDMSLDEIIKLERKNRQQPGGSRIGAGKIATSKRGVAQGRRGGRRTTLAVKRRVARPKPNATVSRLSGNGRAIRRLQPRVPVGKRSALGKFASQRIARNLIKRAMLRKRRQAISVRSSNMNQPPVRRNPETRRLAEQVRKWRNTAKLLHNALQIEATKNQRRRIRLPINRNRGQVIESNSMQNRLGWRSNRPASVRRGNFNRNLQSNRGGAPFGQMQSDLLSRQQETAKRIEADILARYQTRRNFPSRRAGRRNFAYNSGNSFNGRINSRGRGLQSMNDFTFPTNRMRAFGGGAGVKSYRGRFNNRQRYY